MNEEQKKAKARINTINYHLARFSDRLRQPEIEKLVQELEQLKKVLKCQK